MIKKCDRECKDGVFPNVTSSGGTIKCPFLGKPGYCRIENPERLANNNSTRLKKPPFLLTPLEILLSKSLRKTET
ncbi:hypothetical protein AMJ49_06990 [Parcubacteria bacterium DG_74_2]|nr:MAG: hypothetical protein AMJ49_06990 [Parcubacteria bacterium DG_74_2]